MNTSLFIAATQLAAIVIGITAIWLNLRALRHEMQTNTFMEYTGRYARIWDDLPPPARSRKGGFDLDTLASDQRVELLNVVRGYLNLCSEEYWLYQRKRIDNGTWEIWRLGMIDTVKLPWFGHMWEEVKEEYRYYHDFTKLMNDCFAASADEIAKEFAESLEDRR